MYKKVRLKHYANHRHVDGFIATPTSGEEISEAIGWAVNRGIKVIPTGTQNSFSDIFLASDQLHLSMLAMNRLLAFDPINAEVSVQSGMRIWDLLKLIIPQGFYLCGLSGSHTDTIGGMLSSNCHGKDSWKWGNFGENVLSLTMMDHHGYPRVLYPHDMLFKAVIAGLGGLGVVTDITLKLKKIPSAILSASSKVISIEDAINIKLEGFDYCYGWLDLLTNKQDNCILRTATFNPFSDSSFNELDSKETLWNKNQRTLWKGIRMAWNPITYKVVNKSIRFAESVKKSPTDVPLIDFLYPWKKTPGVRYVFKRNSFFELQAIFPYETVFSAFQALKALIRKNDIHPMMSAIKWHKTDDFLLSFSGSGISISNTFDSTYLDSKSGEAFKQSYIELVLKFGGNFYLSKFPYLTKEQLLQSYHYADEWIRIKKKQDPQNVFYSDRLKQLLEE